MNSNFRNFAIWVFIGLLLVALFNLFQSSGGRGPQASVPYSDFVTAVESGQVSEVVIKGNQITGQYSDGRPFSTYAPQDPQLVPRGDPEDRLSRPGPEPTLCPRGAFRRAIVASRD